MKLRMATHADVLTIGELAENIWWPTYSGYIPSEQISLMLNEIYAEAALKSQIDEGVNFLIAEYGEKPIALELIH